MNFGSKVEDAHLRLGFIDLLEVKEHIDIMRELRTETMFGRTLTYRLTDSNEANSQFCLTHVERVLEHYIKS